jgi:hypothetical protein
VAGLVNHLGAFDAQEAGRHGFGSIERRAGRAEEMV